MVEHKNLKLKNQRKISLWGIQIFSCKSILLQRPMGLYFELKVFGVYPLPWNLRIFFCELWSENKPNLGWPILLSWESHRRLVDGHFSRKRSGLCPRRSARESLLKAGNAESGKATVLTLITFITVKPFLEADPSFSSVFRAELWQFSIQYICHDMTRDYFVKKLDDRNPASFFQIRYQIIKTVRVEFVAKMLQKKSNKKKIFCNYITKTFSWHQKSFSSVVEIQKIREERNF